MPWDSYSKIITGILQPFQFSGVFAVVNSANPNLFYYADAPLFTPLQEFHPFQKLFSDQLVWVGYRPRMYPDDLLMGGR